MRKTLTMALLCAVGALTACGAPGSSDDGTTAPSHESASATSAAHLPASPGSVVIGSADFPESEVLAYVYADALAAKGVHTSVHADIGERSIYITGLTQGSIGAVPDYTGALLDYLDHGATARTPQAVGAQLARAAAQHGLVLGRYAPAQDVDTITVTRATASRYHLHTIADLVPVAGRMVLGAPAPFRTVSYGTPALAATYGVRFGRFLPLSAGGTFTETALKDGTVQAADIFSTDPTIAANGFVSLADPRHIFAAENVVPVFRQDVLTRPMLAAADAVSARLDTRTLTDLDEQVENGVQPAVVAHHWVSAEHLG